MKKISILATILMAIIFGTAEAQNVSIWKDGECVARIANADSIVFENDIIEPAATTGELNGHEWVQLWEGGVRFATMNLGAGKISGSLTACGGTPYSWEAAQETAGEWGDGWRLPTADELRGIQQNCDLTWYDGEENKYLGGATAGVLIAGRGAYADNEVFMPAAGFEYFGLMMNENYMGCWWTCDDAGADYPTDAMFFGGMYDDWEGGVYANVDQCYKTYGYNVRFVCDPE